MAPKASENLKVVISKLLSIEDIISEKYSDEAWDKMNDIIDMAKELQATLKVEEAQAAYYGISHIHTDGDACLGTCPNA